MKLKQTVLAIASLGILVGASAVVSQDVNALDCVILPPDICGSAENGTLQESGTWKLIELAITILTGAVGFVAVAMIAYAAFLYTTAQESAEQTKQAKDMIRNVVIGLLVYVMMWAALQWLIPGGIFE